MGSAQTKHDQETVWSERKRYLTMPLGEKRKHYFCKTRYIPSERIVTWRQYFMDNIAPSTLTTRERFTCAQDEELNNKVALLVSDITLCEVDGIVSSVQEGREKAPGKVARAILERAGEYYKDECIYKGIPSPGGVKVMGGYKLPARYVINTTVPKTPRHDLLKDCYINSLESAIGHGMRTVAFPCLTSSKYTVKEKDLPDNVALDSVRQWLKENKDRIDLTVFCVFTEENLFIYEDLMQLYFPVCDSNSEYRRKLEANHTTAWFGLLAVTHFFIQDKHNTVTDCDDEKSSLEDACTNYQLSEWQENTRSKGGIQLLTLVRCSGASQVKQLRAIYNNPSIDLCKRPLIKYMDEEGLDMGAISREFFFQSLELLTKQQLGAAPAWEGEMGHRLPCASKIHSDEEVYELSGKVLAHSILHSGIGLVGLAPPIVFLLSHPVNKTEVKLSGILLDLLDLPDVELREFLQKADQLSNLQEDEQQMVRRELCLAMERCNIGYLPITAKTITAIQQEILLYEVVYKRWDQIEQLRSGMDALSLYSFLCKNPAPQNTRKVFPDPGDMLITPDIIKAKIQRNDVSNDLFTHFYAFLTDLHLGNIDNLSLSDVLAFWTGASTLTCDQLNISVGDRNQLPRAHCCFNQLQLPDVSSYEELKEKFIYALNNGSKGFTME